MKKKDLELIQKYHAESIGSMLSLQSVYLAIAARTEDETELAELNSQLYEVSSVLHCFSESVTPQLLNKLADDEMTVGEVMKDISRMDSAEDKIAALEALEEVTKRGAAKLEEALSQPPEYDGYVRDAILGRWKKPPTESKMDMCDAINQRIAEELLSKKNELSDLVRLANYVNGGYKNIRDIKGVLIQREDYEWLFEAMRFESSYLSILANCNNALMVGAACEVFIQKSVLEKALSPTSLIKRYTEDKINASDLTGLEIHKSNYPLFFDELRLSRSVATIKDVVGWGFNVEGVDWRFNLGTALRLLYEDEGAKNESGKNPAHDECCGNATKERVEPLHDRNINDSTDWSGAVKTTSPEYGIIEMGYNLSLPHTIPEAWRVKSIDHSTECTTSNSPDSLSNRLTNSAIKGDGTIDTIEDFGAKSIKFYSVDPDTIELNNLNEVVGGDFEEISAREYIEHLEDETNEPDNLQKLLDFLAGGETSEEQLVGLKIKSPILNLKLAMLDKGVHYESVTHVKIAGVSVNVKKMTFIVFQPSIGSVRNVSFKLSKLRKALLSEKTIIDLIREKLVEQDSKQLANDNIEPIAEGVKTADTPGVTFIDFVNWVNSDSIDVKNIEGFEFPKDGNEDLFKQLGFYNQPVKLVRYSTGMSRVCFNIGVSGGTAEVSIEKLREVLNPKSLLDRAAKENRKYKALVGLEIRREDYPDVFKKLCGIGGEDVLIVKGYYPTNCIEIKGVNRYEWTFNIDTLLEWMSKS